MAYTVARGDTMGGIAQKLGVSLSALAAANPQIANINRITPGMVINSPGGGAGGAPAPAAPAAAPAAGGFSVEEAMSAYGFVFTLANAIPDLKAILDQAIAQEWTPDHLTAQVESSQWWNNNADTVRNLVTQQYTDPSTYRQNLANAVNMIHLKAQQLGRQLDEPTAQRLALQTLTENGSWDDQRLSQLLTNNSGLVHGSDHGAVMGTAANYADHMTKIASSYGVAYTTDWLDSWINEVESGRNTLDGFDAVIRARAKAQFPQYADQLDAGMTIRDIADPYIATMAQTLEMAESDISLTDPYIKKALSTPSPDGVQRAVPMWQFQRQLKDDPRYDKTLGARQDAYSALGKIGAAFGFFTGSN